MRHFFVLFLFISQFSFAFRLHFADKREWKLPEQVWDLFQAEPAQGICSYYEDTEEKNFYIHIVEEEMLYFLSLFHTFHHHGLDFDSEDLQKYIGTSVALWNFQVREIFNQASQIFNVLNWQEIQQENNFSLQILEPNVPEAEKSLLAYLSKMRNKILPAIFRCDLITESDAGEGSYGKVLVVYDWRSPFYDIFNDEVVEEGECPRAFIFKQINKFTQKRSSTKEVEIGLELSDIPEMAGMIGVVIDAQRDAQSDGFSADHEQDEGGESEEKNISSIMQQNLPKQPKPSSKENILGFLGYFTPLSSLDVFMQNQENAKYITKESMMAALKGLWQGITMMHSRGIVHRDIKMNNILVYPGDEPGRFIWKLSDFGLSDRMGTLKAFPGAQRKKYCPLENYEPSLSCFLNSPSIDLYQFGRVLDGIATLLWHYQKESWAFFAFGPLVKYMTIWDPRRKRIDYSFIASYLHNVGHPGFGKDFIYLQHIGYLPVGTKSIRTEESFEGLIAINSLPSLYSFLTLAKISAPFHGNYWFLSDQQPQQFPFIYSLDVGAVCPGMILYFPRGLPFAISGSFTVEEKIQVESGDWFYIDSNYANHTLCLHFIDQNNPEVVQEQTECYQRLHCWQIFNLISLKLKKLKEKHPQLNFPVQIIAK